MNNIKDIDLNRTPKHVAIIMDGNGRWAKQQGEMRLFGHQWGVEAVRETLKIAKELKVKHLTLYAFSTENWNRPQEEVDGLMDLLVRTIANEVDELNASGVSLKAIGNLEGLPQNCQLELQEAIQATAHNVDIDLILALNYSSKWELTEAIKCIGQKMVSGELSQNDITPELISSYLATKDIPDPELLIRTSGEHRISNFLLWQIAYAEFYFTPVLWPDFKREHFIDAVYNYQNRERRFGMTSEQIEKL